MWQNGLAARFRGLTEEEQARVQAELRPIVESSLASWGPVLASLDGERDPEELQRVFDELQALEELEDGQLRTAGAGQARDPLEELERLVEQGKADQIDLKAMLEEVLEVAGIFGKPAKRVKTAR